MAKQSIIVSPPKNQLRAPRILAMKRACSFVVLLFSFQSIGNAENLFFERCKLADAKGTQSKATLTLSESNKDLEIRETGHDSISVPYDSLDKLSYEYSRKHRITTGALLLAITPLGVGGLAMLSKSKSHWLYIDFHDQDGKRTIVLRLDKKDVAAILDAFKKQTGRDVINLGEVK
jgi:hypothetical protein